MWIVPSRSRPHNIARLIAAWRDTGATARVILCVDEDDPQLGMYKELPISLAPGWTTMIGSRGGLSEIYNRVFHRWPNETWYGIGADDMLPETSRWDETLATAAGNNRLAFGDDGVNGGKHATHFVLGGDLVRQMGWLAYPGLSRIYIDTIWNDIADAANVRVYLPDVKLTHMHPGAGRAHRDDIYKKPIADKLRDKAVYEDWKKCMGMR